MKAAELARALAATVSLASEVGLTVDDAIVVQNSNRVALRLVPCGVLARVAGDVRRNPEVAAFELQVAQELGGVDSSIGALESRVEPTVHRRDGFVVTFWRYYEPLPASEITPTEYAHALERVHAEMQQSDVAAPHLTDRVDEAHAIVRDRSLSPDLADADRALLANSLRSLRRSIVDRGTDEQLLHGEPHVGNLVRTTSGIRFIDLETCCYGPVEFDLAHASDEVGQHYLEADPVQLRDCRILVLAMVAAWRSDRSDQFPNGGEMLGANLSGIRKALNRHGIDVRD